MGRNMDLLFYLNMASSFIVCRAGYGEEANSSGGRNRVSGAAFAPRVIHA